MLLEKPAVRNLNRNDGFRISEKENVLRFSFCNRSRRLLRVIGITIEEAYIIRNQLLCKPVDFQVVVLRLITQRALDFIARVVRGNNNLTFRVVLNQKPDRSSQQRFAADFNQMLGYVVIVLPARSLAVSHNDIFHSFFLCPGTEPAGLFLNNTVITVKVAEFLVALTAPKLNDIHAR